ncbi:MAG TPA: serine/threonine protein kinase [Kiritimatiellia bacterium]|nr:serine/threonine protein kinase [Kiritimatiellia bacterium]HRZ12680.1 serine/threonine protein kinase [Kiritimatiellia bacterium]HSA19552.1 serine/threonine protein kinase [Kiritimatiellia bacterium]
MDTADFSHLTPEAVINAVEATLGVPCTNICRPLNSYINRVYEVGLDDGGYVIAKFYRPGRWDRVALQDELDFLAELAEEEVPVVPPLPGRDGALLHDLAHTAFAIFPKRGGRPLDEPDANTWTQLGRLLARMHAVGARRLPKNRVTLHPEHSTRQHLDFILRSGTIPSGPARAYERLVTELIELVAPDFEGVETHRIHGDCHRQNILHRPGEGFHLLDFDDMAVGPAVQDLWMLLPDRVRAARVELESLLEGYETFLPFPRETLGLVEPLRAMRFIHYTAWCARQKADGGFARLAPDWGSQAFWRQETADLERQRQEILDAR